MRTCAENLMLEDDIPGVRLEDRNFEDPVLVLIPAGDVIHVDQNAPRIGRMQPVEWQGSKYGVFPQDLLKRSESN
jgi:hypothetical protein